MQTAAISGPGAGASPNPLSDTADGNGNDGRVTITYTPSPPSGVVAKVAYPKKGGAKGKAVVSWRPAARATGYQTRLAKSKKKLKRASWSRVHPTRKRVVARKSFSQYLEVRATNAAGHSAAKRVVIKRR